MQTLTVGLGERSYPIQIGSGQDNGSLAELENDDTEVTLYLNGRERSFRISELVKK